MDPYLVKRISLLVRISYLVKRISFIKLDIQGTFQVPHNKSTLHASRFTLHASRFTLHASLLILLFPLAVRHTVYVFPCLLVVHIQAAFLGSCKIPFRQAIPAETGQVHQIDILHFLMFSQM